VRSGYLREEDLDVANAEGLSGSFNSKTKEALMQWQKEKGLPVTGFFGPISREVMAASETTFFRPLPARSNKVTLIQQQVSNLSGGLSTFGGSQNAPVFAALVGLLVTLQVTAIFSGAGEKKNNKDENGSGNEGGNEGDSLIHLPPLPPLTQAGQGHGPLHPKLQYGLGPSVQRGASPFQRQPRQKKGVFHTHEEKAARGGGGGGPLNGSNKPNGNGSATAVQGQTKFTGPQRRRSEVVPEEPKKRVKVPIHSEQTKKQRGFGFGFGAKAKSNSNSSSSNPNLGGGGGTSFKRPVVGLPNAYQKTKASSSSSFSGAWFVDTRSSEPLSFGNVKSSAPSATMVEGTPDERKPPAPRGGGTQTKIKAAQTKVVREQVVVEQEVELSEIQQKYMSTVERAQQQRLTGQASPSLTQTATVSVHGKEGGGEEGGAPTLLNPSDGVFSISNLQKKVITLNQTVENLSGRQGRLDELQSQIDSLEKMLKIKIDDNNNKGGTNPSVSYPDLPGRPAAGPGADGGLSGDNFQSLKRQLREISSSMDQRVNSILRESTEVLEKRLQHVEHQLENVKAQSQRKEQLLNEQIVRLEGIADQKLERGNPSDKQLGWFGVLGAMLGYAASEREKDLPAASPESSQWQTLMKRVEGIETKLKSKSFLKDAEEVQGKKNKALVDIEKRLKVLETAWTTAPKVASEVVVAEEEEVLKEPSPSAVIPSASTAAAAAPLVLPKINTDVMLWRMDHGREILLQGFHWESHKHSWYNIIREKVPEIKTAGFSGVWFPPPSDSIAPQGYLPRDLYNLNTSYGSMDQLKSVIACMGEYELHPMADIVVNHRCATSRGSGGKWNRWDGTKMSWDERAICQDNPQFGGQGNRKSGDDFTAAPNIDHSQDFVRSDLKEWLKWLISEVGFRSLRFDFVKGYSGEYVGEYVEACQPEYSVGEYWDTLQYSDGGLEYNQDHHRQRTVNWIDQTKGRSSAFDFTTKGILQEACGRNEMWRLADSKGQPSGVIGVWPSHAVTFIDNHDTGSTQSHWPFPADKVLWGYAYTLTHPGTPSVFWEHFFDWGSDVRKKLEGLIEVRRKADIHSRSKVKILEAKNDLYAAEIDGKVCMKIGSGSWSPGGAGWTLACSGSGFAVWTNV
jgi:alpha-amylase